MYIDGTEPLLEQAVRTLFEDAGFFPLDEYGVGGGVEPTRMLRYALPNAVTEATSLITDLFRRGFGLSETVRLRFNYYEDG